MKKVLLSLCFLITTVISVSAQISITTTNTPKTENFDVMGATTNYPTGWTGLRYAGTGTIGQVLNPTVNNGSGNSGAIYNVGTTGASDRALGTLASGSTFPRFGTGFQNNTGVTVTSISLAGFMEQWRTGSNTVVEIIEFEYSFNATGINDATATWVKLSSMDLVEKLTTTTTAAAVDGNLDDNRTAISGEITNLTFANTQTIWIRWSDVDNAGSDGLYAIDDFSITFNGPSGEPNTDPVVNTSKNSITFPGTTLIGQNSASQTFTISGENLTANVSLTVAAPFSISKDDNTFGTSLSYTPADLGMPQTVFVRYTAANLGTESGNIVINSTGITDRNLPLSAVGSSPFAYDFNACSGANLGGGFTQFSVTGAQVWGCTNFGRNGSIGAQMNGFSNGAVENEDWLISPSYDFTTFDFPVLSFWSQFSFNGPGLKLMVSTDYVSGDPTQATWTEINGRFPTNSVSSSSTVFTESKDINLAAFKAANVHIAFVYTSSPALGASRWTLDDYAIVNSPDAPPAPMPSINSSIGPLSNLNFGFTPNGTPTAGRQFTFTAFDFTNNLLINGAQGFEFSKDNVSYNAEISYTPAELNGNRTFFIRYNPIAGGANASAGAIRFSSTNLERFFGFATGSQINTTETFDVVTWNIEWFGHPSNGPSDVNLQLQNAKQVIESLDADIYQFQEISNTSLFNQLVASLPNHKGFLSPYVSGNSVTLTTQDQKLGFIYKTSTVDSIAARPLLLGAQSQIVNYPTGNASSFWASGRLPYMFIADATVAGIKKRVHLVGIHAKANESGANAQVAYNRRVFDNNVLKDSLDAQFGNVNLILLGDYNDDVDVTVANISETTNSSYKMFTDDTQNYKVVTDVLSNAGLRSFISLDNVIDHVMISDELFQDYLSSSSKVIIPFDLISDYQTTTSDHLPVMARFKFMQTTSLFDKRFQIDFKVVPNPITDRVRIQLPTNLSNETIKISVYSLDGKLIFTKTGEKNLIENQLNESIADINTGIYFLKLEGKDFAGQTKFIKQ